MTQCNFVKELFVSYLATLIHTAGDTLFDFWGTGGQVFAFVPDARSPGGARVIWNTTFGKPIGRAFVAENAIYVETQENTLIRINKRTGVIEQEYPLLWEGGLPQIRDNVAYVGSDRYLYAMKFDAAIALSSVTSAQKP